MFEKNWQELIKPTKIDIERETCSVYYVRFSAEPFERGLWDNDRQFLEEGAPLLDYGRGHHLREDRRRRP